MTEIAGSLWSVDPEDQLSAALRLRDAGLRRLHWDTTDGVFAATGGFDAERARVLTRATGLAAEAHLMVTHPAKEVDKWTDFCDLVVVHVESQDWQHAVARITARGCLPGIAISPQTPTHVLPQEVPVLCMTITPGTAGSPFDHTGLAKLTQLRRTDSGRRLGLDGGLQRPHQELAEREGADWLVVGTDLFFRDGERRWADVLRTGQSPAWRRGAHAATSTSTPVDDSRLSRADA